MNNEIILRSDDREAQIVHFDYHMIHPKRMIDGELSKKETEHTVLYNHTIGHAIEFARGLINNECHCVQCYCDGSMVFDMYIDNGKVITAFSKNAKLFIE